MTASAAEARGRLVAVLDRIGTVVTGVGFVMLIAYLLGSLLLTGGQMGASLDPNFDQVMPWPVFWVPAWLAIALAAVALLAFVPMAALARPLEAPRVERAFRFILAGVCVPSALWMFAFPSVVVERTWQDTDPSTPGAHWVALVIGVVAAVLVMVLGWRAIREHDRAKRA